MSDLIYLVLGAVVSFFYSLARFDLLEEETIGQVVEQFVVWIGAAMLLREMFG